MRPFNSYEIRITHDEDDMHYLRVTGTMAHWYVKKSVYEFKMSSCSIGSSVMLVHRIGTEPSVPSVHRLAFSIYLLHEMAANITDSHNSRECGGRSSYPAIVTSTCWFG